MAQKNTRRNVATLGKRGGWRVNLSSCPIFGGKKRMKKILMLLMIPAVVMGLSGCPAVSTAPTSSSFAPAAQVAQTETWATACQGYNLAKAEAALAAANGAIPHSDYTAILVGVAGIDQLCMTPTNQTNIVAQIQNAATSIFLKLPSTYQQGAVK